MISVAGHKVSFITSSPIMKTIYGSGYYITGDKVLKDKPIDKSVMSKRELLKYNISLFEEHLQASLKSENAV